jgi:hypothetical protein
MRPVFSAAINIMALPVIRRRIDHFTPLGPSLIATTSARL